MRSKDTDGYNEAVGTLYTLVANAPVKTGRCIETRNISRAMDMTESKCEKK